MNKAYSIIRVCILLIIGCAGTLFLFGEEQDNSFFAYLFHLIIDKTLGFLLLALTIFLFNKWASMTCCFSSLTSCAMKPTRPQTQ